MYFYYSDILLYKLADLIWVRYHGRLVKFVYGKYLLVWVFSLDYISTENEPLHD